MSRDVPSLMTHRCRLYGVDVESPFLLGHPAPGAGEPDVRITVGDTRIAADPSRTAEGRTVAEYSPGRPHYTLLDQGAGGYFYRIHDFVDLDISPDLRDVHCELVIAAAEGLLPVVLTGHVLATLMLLRGDLVFHASAVEVEGRAIAFVGNSGAGKSTLAAVACHRGGRLVTDDVLRVDPADTGAGPVCFRGSASLRLRPSSKALAETTNGNAGGARSADGRHLLAAEPTLVDRLPLGAVFIPRLRDPDHPLLRTALEPKDALFALLGFPRVHGWRDPKTTAEHFDKLATVVQQVPVYFLDVPWGVPVEGPWFDRLTDLVFDLNVR